MARKSLTDKFNELSDLVATLTGQVTTLRQEVEGIGTEQGKAGESISELRTALDSLVLQMTELKGWKDSVGSLGEIKVGIAVLKRRTDELEGWKDDVKKQGEEWGRKLWMIVPPIIAGILTFLLGYYFGGKK